MSDYNARYYSARLGRFVSADTIVPDFANPQNLNRYTYTRNSPLRFVDPTGHCAIMEDSADGLCVRTDTDGQLNGIVRGGSYYRNFVEMGLGNAIVTGNPNYLNHIPEGTNPSLLQRSLRAVTDSGASAWDSILDFGVSVGTALGVKMFVDDLMGLSGVRIGNGYNSNRQSDVIGDPGPGPFNPLDWDAVISNQGETRPVHVRRHNINDLTKEFHGVIVEDAMSTIDHAWSRAQSLSLRPDQNGRLLVPMDRPVGWQGGYEGNRQNLYNVQIIVIPETNQIITGYPK